MRGPNPMLSVRQPLMTYEQQVHWNQEKQQCEIIGRQHHYLSIKSFHTFFYQAIPQAIPPSIKDSSYSFYETLCQFFFHSRFCKQQGRLPNNSEQPTSNDLKNQAKEQRSQKPNNNDLKTKPKNSDLLNLRRVLIDMKNSYTKVFSIPSLKMEICTFLKKTLFSTKA